MDYWGKCCIYWVALMTDWNEFWTFEDNSFYIYYAINRYNFPGKKVFLTLSSSDNLICKFSTCSEEIFRLWLVLHEVILSSPTIWVRNSHPFYCQWSKPGTWRSNSKSWYSEYKVETFLKFWIRSHFRCTNCKFRYKLHQPTAQFTTISTAHLYKWILATQK